MANIILSEEEYNELKKRAAKSDYYKEKPELLEERNNNQFDIIGEKNKKLSELEEKLKKANELADSWKKDYERVRDQFIYPIYNILYPDNPNLDINVTDFLNNIKDLKVYADENGSMYKEVQEWREKCISRGKDIDRLSSENKELEARVKYWGDIATGSTGQIINFKDEIRKLNQTISDQEITIKALLITIKEMCKEDETNE